MERRINYMQVAPGAFEAMFGFSKYLQKCGLEESLLNLVYLRASQINGCAYCLDMHWKDLRAAGEGEQRLYGLDAWEESPYYSDRERAALAWTEAVTNVREGHVPDEVYERARMSFSEKELADLTLAVTVINSWNRLNIAARTVPGTYQPAKPRELKKGA
ncbi:MAG: carboxymuconolactone decarboxylase [Acidobacteria bacterium]|nr:MAG: carboxymuconolactone decarboxylase [Acidobacteriota bacterium]